MQWSGVYRYTLFQGTYPPDGAADCQLKYWVTDDPINEGDMYMNKTYRSGSFSGDANLDTASPAKWTLTLDQGDVYLIAMVETDYDNYAAYVECDLAHPGVNYPVISSPNLDGVDEATVDRLTAVFADLGANADNMVKIVHDQECDYLL